ncbi:MAG: FMN-binding protein [Methylophilaceae bacterium]|nr:FMN-binding protein [Methylophilaceae bacterium]
MNLRSCVPALLLLAQSAYALEDVILPPQRFVEEALGSPLPKAQVVWLTKDVAEKAAQILGHAPSQLRQRYWSGNGKTVWVLEEIGKEEPITAGFVIAGGRILQARVLVYRESRGGEIRYPAFLKQYENASLTPDARLDRSIDGIAGATLSVRAMERMARLALYLDSIVQGNTP